MAKTTPFAAEKCVSVKSRSCLLLGILLMATCSFSKGNEPSYKNIWHEAPAVIPADFSVDAPLMGNGDFTMTAGYKDKELTFYFGKNDFWSLNSKYGMGMPRLAGMLIVSIAELSDSEFRAEQEIKNGITTITIGRDKGIKVRSWISANENVAFFELNATDAEMNCTVRLTCPTNPLARRKSGEEHGIYWLTREFSDCVEMPSGVALAAIGMPQPGENLNLSSDKVTLIAVAIRSSFEAEDPLREALTWGQNFEHSEIQKKEILHNKWWENFWSKSSVTMEDSVLMKAYHQGLYTMASCSRNPKFPPGIFGWITTDTPAWHGDYHLNYNFQAPFYALHSSNRLEQALPHDAPIIDFMERGSWYAANVTNTRGVLYPVGIGPLGIEVTRDADLVSNYPKKNDVEKGGYFFGQRSNAAYALVNMAQYWRCTYDAAYGRKIYPYALSVCDFWEDYLTFEDGRYVIYNDAIHEGSGFDKNPILSLGLIRNSFNLMLDLSETLQVDAHRKARWKDILDRLSDYPVQERNGKKVFRYTEEGIAWWPDNGLGIQHIYPANGITPDSPAEQLEIARNTIYEMNRWRDFNTTNSYYVAAVRSGIDPEVIMDNLTSYALNTYPNGFQANNPHGIENSCTVANAINEMLCMSVGNVIRLFANWPKTRNASFNNIRTWGAFLVSSEMKNGTVIHVHIFSEKGKPLTLVNPWIGMQVVVYRNGQRAERVSGDRLFIQTSAMEHLEFRPEKQ
jgi:alpha-L-fucosidase 2